MKLNFYQSNKSNWGDLQKQVSELLLKGLDSGKDFYVQFGSDKSPSQLRGFYRVCDVLAPYFEESQGVKFDKDMVKEVVKQACGYTVKVRDKVITKSLKHASKEDMTKLIEKLYEIGQFFNAKDYQLTSAEEMALAKYYENK